MHTMAEKADHPCHQNGGDKAVQAVQKSAMAGN
jgi:hypothetical protein